MNDTAQHPPLDPLGSRPPREPSASDEARDLALIVPVRGDAEPLAALLGAISTWTLAPREMIIVTSSEDEAEVRPVCRQHRCRHVVHDGSRGARLDTGARAARAPVLWFLHADAAPPPDGLRAIAEALARGAESGCFSFRFQGERTWYKTLLEHMVALRTRAGGMAYGDQGLFVRRSVYLECGGFAHQPLFEEVSLVGRLRARGTFRLLGTDIGVSTRRWDQDGWLRRTLHNRWLALCYICGVPPQRLAARYRRPRRLDEEIRS